ncbi:MAG: methyl-accepting chemotaxis protein [Phycisphaerales bacterium]
MSWIKSLGLSAKITSLAVITLLVVLVINYVVFLRGYRADAEVALSEKAAAFTAVADEAKVHTGRLFESGAINTEKLVAEAQEALANGQHYSETAFFDAIPVVAGWKAAGEAAAREGIDFQIAAFNARNPDNEVDRSSFEGQLLADLEAQVDAGGGDTMHRIDRDQNRLLYMRAVKLDSSCMTCHGEPGHPVGDPDGDGMDLLGFKMERWSVGDTHGAYAVSLPLEGVDASVANFFTTGAAFTTPVVVIGIGLFMYVLRLMVIKPVGSVVAVVKDIAQGDGDLTTRMGIKRKDEIGQLAHWFDQFLDGLHGIISQVRGATGEVSAAATEIAASSEQMANGLEHQRTQTGQVSAAIEEMSGSVREVAAKSQDAVEGVRSSTKNATEGGEVVSQTVGEMHSISAQVNASADAVRELGAKSEQIGEIISVINEIADQTNLLALNAAIEAARAGEHGRGFAVVADEVRKLAERTTSATEEVAKSIREIQSETERAVSEISTSTERVDAGVKLAVTAGEALQRIVAGSENLRGMVESISAAAAQQASASDEIARSTEAINAVTGESAQGAAQAAQAAAQLSQAAESLQSLVNRFKL